MGRPTVRVLKPVFAAMAGEAIRLTAQDSAESSNVLWVKVTPYVDSWLMWGESPPAI